MAAAGPRVVPVQVAAAERVPSIEAPAAMPSRKRRGVIETELGDGKPKLTYNGIILRWGQQAIISAGSILGKQLVTAILCFALVTRLGTPQYLPYKSKNATPTRAEIRRHVTTPSKRREFPGDRVVPSLVPPC